MLEISVLLRDGTDRKRSTGACTLLGPEGPVAARFVSAEGAQPTSGPFRRSPEGRSGEVPPVL